MNKEQFISELEELESLIKEQLDMFQALDKVFGSVDGDLTDSVFCLQSFAIKQLAEIAGDTDEWIDWYMFERSATAIDESGLKHEITTARELVEFVGWFGKEG